MAADETVFRTAAASENTGSDQQVTNQHVAWKAYYMAQPFGQTGTADPIARRSISPGNRRNALFGCICTSTRLTDLARDVIERSQGLPVEVGGLLLGHATRGEKPAVWIVERYQRVECEHRSGPHFVLGEDEHPPDSNDPGHRAFAG